MKFLTEEQSHSIKTVMFAKKVSIKDLPNRIGGSRNNWQNKINGISDFRMQEVIQLSKVLDLKQEEIISLFFPLAS